MSVETHTCRALANPRLSANPGLAVRQVPTCGRATSPLPFLQLCAKKLRSPWELIAPSAQAPLVAQKQAQRAGGDPEPLPPAHQQDKDSMPGATAAPSPGSGAGCCPSPIRRGWVCRGFVLEEEMGLRNRELSRSSQGN